MHLGKRLKQGVCRSRGTSEEKEVLVKAQGVRMLSSFIQQVDFTALPLTDIQPIWPPLKLSTTGDGVFSLIIYYRLLYEMLFVFMSTKQQQRKFDIHKLL